MVRLRPTGYFVRIQAAIETIRAGISQRLCTGRWPVGLSRARQGHWLRALMRNAVAYFGNAGKGRLLGAFDRLIGLGIIPVSRAIYTATGTVFESPYPSVS